MIKSATDFILGVWNAPEVPLRVEYPLEMMEELRALVSDELQRLSRGGTDAAGLLFGVSRGPAVRILTWRPISRGSADEQSANSALHDRAELVRVLGSAATDPDMRGLEPLGWFVSRTQGGTGLIAPEVELYNNFFPHPRQFTLLLRRGPGGTARAGFFVRDAEGFLRADASYRELLIQPVRRVPSALEPATSLLAVPAIEEVSRLLAEPPRDVSSATEPSPSNFVELTVPSEPPEFKPASDEPMPEPVVLAAPAEVTSIPQAAEPLPETAAARIEAPAPAPATAPASATASALATAPIPVEEASPRQAPPDEPPGFVLQAHSFGGARWLWVFPLLLAVGIVVFLLMQKTASVPIPSFSLRVAAVNNDVEIAWDRSSIPARDGERADIQIQDGPNSKQLSLSAEQLHDGKMSYVRETGDVALQMIIYAGGGREFHEFAHLVAISAPAADTPSAQESPGGSQLRAERDDLQNQVLQLKEQVRKEAARADQAESVVKILENRLKIRPDDEKK